MTRTDLLKYALVAFGVIFLLVYPLAIVWPSGWAWHEGAPYESDYFMMIVGVYATLGVFLILAARDPEANRSLIMFTSGVEPRPCGESWRISPCRCPNTWDISLATYPD